MASKVRQSIKNKSPNRATRICIAGATGVVGRCLVSAVQAVEDMKLVSAVARSAAGRDLGEVLGGTPMNLRVDETVDAALEAGVDVLIDYTHPAAVRGHIETAIARCAKGINDSLKYAATRGVFLALENHADLASLALAHTTEADELLKHYATRTFARVSIPITIPAR